MVKRDNARNSIPKEEKSADAPIESEVIKEIKVFTRKLIDNEFSEVEDNLKSEIQDLKMTFIESFISIWSEQNLTGIKKEFDKDNEAACRLLHAATNLRC